MPRLRQLQAVAVALLPLVVGATTSSNTALETKNYIDTISGYVELSTCAAEVLSTIVRAQSSGCGDNGALTSYTCFCTDSSSQFSYEISSAVMTSCDSSVATAQASSALAVFDGYCALGVEAGLSTTAVSSTQTATSSASPAASATTTSPTETSTTSAGSTSSSSGASNTTAIAAGVVIPIVVIAFGLIGWFFYRKRRQSSKNLPDSPVRNNGAIEVQGHRTMQGVSEMPTFEQVTHEVAGKEYPYLHATEDASHQPQELASHIPPSELEGDLTHQRDDHAKYR